MACMCMGPQNGEPLCPCLMRAARAHLGVAEPVPPLVFEYPKNCPGRRVSWYDGDECPRCGKKHDLCIPQQSEEQQNAN